LQNGSGVAVAAGSAHREDVDARGVLVRDRRQGELDRRPAKLRTTGPSWLGVAVGVGAGVTVSDGASDTVALGLGEVVSSSADEGDDVASPQAARSRTGTASATARPRRFMPL
jgi:hypothetical protein